MHAMLRDAPKGIRTHHLYENTSKRFMEQIFIITKGIKEMMRGSKMEGILVIKTSGILIQTSKESVIQRYS